LRKNKNLGADVQFLFFAFKQFKCNYNKVVDLDMQMHTSLRYQFCHKCDDKPADKDQQLFP
jgi:hypothetical protein